MEELSLQKLVEAFRQYWRHCFVIVAGVTIFAFTYALFLPKRYLAITTIMGAEDKGGGGANSLSQMMGISKGANDSFLEFMAIINSRTFKEKLVDSLGASFFDPVNKTGLSQEVIKARAVGMLNSAIKLRVEPDFSNVLKIMVVMNDPNRPPIVANQLLIELQDFIQNNSVTKAKRLRQYVEISILETKAALFETANAISSFYNRYPVNQTKGIIESPFQKEIDSLRTSNQQGDIVNALNKGPYTTLTAQREALLNRLQAIPEISQQTYFDYLKREYDVLNEINLTLRQQYELAKLDEVKEDPFFQTIDTAKGAGLANPNINIITGTGFFFSILLALSYLTFRSFYHPKKSRAHLPREDSEVIPSVP